MAGGAVDRLAAACFGFSLDCWRTTQEDGPEGAGAVAAASVVAAVDSADLAAGVAGAEALLEAGSAAKGTR